MRVIDMKKAMAAIVAVCLIILFPVCCFADTFNLYANTDPDSTVVSLLISAMKNDSNYDPYNEYVCCRTSENQYKIAFGKKLSGSCTVYTYTSSSYGIPASISKGSASSIYVNSNGYYYTGNVNGALASSKAETFKFQYVILMIAILIAVFVVFRLFRRTRTNKSSYYTIRG